MFRYIINKIIKPKESNKILLGRWTNQGTEIKNIYANHDHCGDIICKDPKEVTSFIKKELSEKTLKLNKNN